MSLRLSNKDVLYIDPNTSYASMLSIFGAIDRKQHEEALRLSAATSGAMTVCVSNPSRYRDPGGCRLVKIGGFYAHMNEQVLNQARRLRTQIEALMLKLNHEQRP